jgi:hypothetical protein
MSGTCLVRTDAAEVTGCLHTRFQSRQICLMNIQSTQMANYFVSISNVNCN